VRSYLLLVKVLVAAAVALALAGPAAAAPHLTKADRAAIDRTLDVLVNSGVKRVDVARSYDVVTPELRAGLSRKAWASGEIPIYPYPARGHTFHGWTVRYVSRDEVGLELILMPQPHTGMGPIVFNVYLQPHHGRWLVDSFMPAAMIAPLNKPPRVIAATDYGPGQGETASGGAKRVSGVYLYVPFGVMGVVLLCLAGWGIAAMRRDRRLRGPRRRMLPPLPARFSGSRGT
jgi:hypothetical protein